MINYWFIVGIFDVFNIYERKEYFYFLKEKYFSKLFGLICVYDFF